MRRTTLPLAQVLVVLDAEATPYTRIWCMFEQACCAEALRHSFFLEFRIAELEASSCQSCRRRSPPLDVYRQGQELDERSALQATVVQGELKLLLDFATVADGKAHVLTEGFAHPNEASARPVVEVLESAGY